MEGKKSQYDAGQALHDLFREVFALQATLSTIMDDVHMQAGLSTSQHKVIYTLNQMEPATVPDVAAMLKISRQAVQTICNDLLSNGLIEFKENPRHKKSKLLTLTKAGRSAFRKARQKENKIIEQALPEIDSKQAKNASKLLKSIRLTLTSGKP